MESDSKSERDDSLDLWSTDCWPSLKLVRAAGLMINTLLPEVGRWDLEVDCFSD